MNYQKIYDSIISSALNRGLNKKILDGYFEIHHIVPRCIGGSNDKSNLVLLTAREHYLCHWLLWKIHKDNKSLFYAYNMICNRNNLIKISSKQFEILKTNFSNITSLNMKGNRHSANCKRTEEFKNKCRNSKMGILNHMFGKIVSDDVKLKIKINHVGMKNKKHSEQSKRKMALSHIKNDPCSINGVLYNSSIYAAEILNMNKQKIRRRILSKSEKFKNYFYI